MLIERICLVFIAAIKSNKTFKGCCYKDFSCDGWNGRSYSWFYACFSLGNHFWISGFYLMDYFYFVFKVLWLYGAWTSIIISRNCLKKKGFQFYHLKRTIIEETFVSGKNSWVCSMTFNNFSYLIWKIAVLDIHNFDSWIAWKAHSNGNN